MSLFEIIEKFISRNQSHLPKLNTKVNDNESDKVLKKEQMSFSEPTGDAGPKLPCGLFYGEVILLNWLNGKELVPEFPLYFTSYGINPLASFNKIKSMNLIRISSPFEGLPSLKNKDLQNILKNYNLKISGKKAELVERITNNVEESDLITEVPQVYILTDAGKEIVKDYNIFIWAHKNASYGSGVIMPINFVDSWQIKDKPENIAFNKINSELNEIIGYKVENYYYNLKLMESLLYKYSNNNQHAFNELCLEFLDSFNMIKNHQFIGEPPDYVSYSLQSEIINFVQKNNDQNIDNMIDDFINKYQEFFTS